MHELNLYIIMKKKTKILDVILKKKNNIYIYTKKISII